LFGDIKNGMSILNDFGKIVQSEWLQTARIRPYVVLDEYVVMPNHFHGILIIQNDGIPDVGATRRVAPTQRRRSGPAPASLGSTISQFKSIVTKRINQLRNVPNAPIWQRNYHEHVIRQESRSIHAIRQYIRNNPAQWEFDPENLNIGHPGRPPL
jgi:putative transposase